MIDPQLTARYWVVRKAICVIGYYGGFRICELKSLTFENLKQDRLGYWFEFVRSKQRGRTAPTSILVPRRQLDWVPVVDDSFRSATDIDPASFVDDYLSQLQADFGVPLAGLTGSFFRGTQGKKGARFIQTPMGKNKISQVGIEFAAELGLHEPECFTGHCWRRSCGTSASDAGVNVTTLMSLMGWATPKTAMEYVNKSKEKCIKMSMYLTNVQRQNRPLILSEHEFQEIARTGRGSSSASALSRLSNVRSVFKKQKVQLSASSVSQGSETVPLSSIDSDPSLVADSFVQVDDRFKDELLADAAALIREVEEEEEVVAASQALISDLEQEEKKDSVASSVQPVSSVVERVGPTLTGMFPNLVNSGSLNINIYFGK